MNNKEIQKEIKEIYNKIDNLFNYNMDDGIIRSLDDARDNIKESLEHIGE